MAVPHLERGTAALEPRHCHDLSDRWGWGGVLYLSPSSPMSLKALVWFWLIDETLSANLVYQSDCEIGSIISSGEATVKIIIMVKPW